MTIPMNYSFNTSSERLEFGGFHDKKKAVHDTYFSWPRSNKSL